jgi:hypothetical protein
MSIHHLECAARTKLPASKKLVLMAFCDDADKLSRIAFPGIEAAMEWSGLGKSRVLEVIAELIDEGYISRLSAGRRGHRAEFRIFDRVACCSMHGPANVMPLGSGQSDPNEDEKGSATADPIDDLGSGPADPKSRKGSGQSDPKSELGSGIGSDSYRTPPVSPVTTKTTTGGAATRNTRGHRLPDDWHPTPDDVAWARAQNYLDDWARHETAQFCDYWHAESGAKATKHDWSKAWKVWLRRDAVRHTPVAPARMTASDKASAWLTMPLDDRKAIGS